ncbi:hypothetical protein FOA52_002924 [Chlamydomonas sp. UWO 241]|nr:hypothetical protein FOA52_002924 [Chlamydomonas sp. UWO 241]
MGGRGDNEAGVSGRDGAAETTGGGNSLAAFYEAWAWKREHLKDRDRLQRPYVHLLDDGSKLTIKQARFKATGFASTVWDSSIVVAKMLEARPELCRGKRCLDLSAGCGLIAVVLARLGASEVVATDLCENELDDNLPLLRDNCEANAPGRVSVLPHCWGRDMESLLPRFDLVVACDVMYVSEAVGDLVDTLAGVVAVTGCGGSVLLAHGRNRGGEGAFMEAAAGRLAVARLPDSELHARFRTDDVSVFRLTPTGTPKAEHVVAVGTQPKGHTRKRGAAGDVVQAESRDTQTEQTKKKTKDAA